MKNTPSDIKEIDERIKDLQKKEGKTTKLVERSPFIYAVAVGFRVGAELLSGVLIGAAIGYFLDALFKTQPLFLVSLLLLGSLAGFLNVYRFAKNRENGKN